MEFFTYILGLIIVLLMYTWKTLLKYVQVYMELCKIPKLPFKSYPLVGHALSLPSEPDKFFKAYLKVSEQLSTEKNNKLGMLWYGLYPADLLVIHPESAEIFLKGNKHTVKSSEYEYVSSWICQGLVTSHGDRWRRKRKLLTPTFHFDILKDFVTVMNEHTDIFIQHIEKEVNCGRFIDLQKRLKLFTLDVICETAMGTTVGVQNDENNSYLKGIQSMCEIIQERVSNPFLGNEFIFRKSKLARKQDEVLNVLHSFTRDVILDRIKKSVNRSTYIKTTEKKRVAFLDLLIRTLNDDGTRLSMEDIQEDVDTFMFAGNHTISSALIFTLYLLGRHRKVQSKLQQEIDSILGSNFQGHVTVEKISKLTYMDAVIKESMRLYPPVAFLGRQTTEECYIDGIKVPKGQDVTIFVHFLHRNPNIWKEPEKFDPNRFSIENRSELTKSNFSYIPFSAGPRNCIGQRFSIQEIKIFLSKFFSKFNVISWDREEDLTFDVNLVFQSLKPLDITITYRNDLVLK